MKITLLAAIGLGAGLFAGSAVGAIRTKRETLAAQDAVTAPAQAEHAVAAPAESEHAAEEPEQGAAETVSLPAAAEHASDTADAPTTTAAASAAEGGAHEDAQPAPPAEVATPEVETAGVPIEASRPAPNDMAGADSLSALNPDGAKKLAKIFSAMKAPAAAAVLVEMSDAEVTAILLRMSDRQAGPIVGAFPPDRAASLGRVVLRGQEGGS